MLLVRLFSFKEKKMAKGLKKKEVTKPKKPVIKAEKPQIKIVKGSTLPTNRPERLATVIDVNLKTKSQSTGEVGVSHVLIEVVGEFKIGQQIGIS